MAASGATVSVDGDDDDLSWHDVLAVGVDVGSVICWVGAAVVTADAGGGCSVGREASLAGYRVT